jgi:hypothetical protein
VRDELGLVRFQVLTALSMKIIAFWDIAPCNLGVDRRLRGAYCLHHQGDHDDCICYYVLHCAQYKYMSATHAFR